MEILRADLPVCPLCHLSCLRAVQLAVLVETRSAVLYELRRTFVPRKRLLREAAKLDRVAWSSETLHIGYLDEDFNHEVS